MSTFIKPDSVNPYLSGITNQLEPFFPDVRSHQNSNLVKCTAGGCHHHFGSPIKCKQPLSRSDLQVVIEKLSTSQLHDNILFLTLLLTGFHGLLWLRELSFPDRIHHRITRKCHFITQSPSTTIITLFSSQDTRVTISTKETQLSSREPTHRQILLVALPPTSHPVTNSILFSPNSGCGKMSPLVGGSWSTSRIFFLQTSEANQCMQVEPHPLQRLVWPHLSSKPLVDRPQTPSRSTSERTPFFCRPYCLGILHMSSLSV